MEVVHIYYPDTKIRFPRVKSFDQKKYKQLECYAQVKLNR